LLLSAGARSTARLQVRRAAIDRYLLTAGRCAANLPHCFEFTDLFMD